VCVGGGGEVCFGGGGGGGGGAGMISDGEGVGQLWGQGAQGFSSNILAWGRQVCVGGWMVWVEVAR
jgi:hypothetical protein